MNKRSWGKSKLRFCPKKGKVWSIAIINGRDQIVEHGMPSYGLPREEMPNGTA